MYRGLGSRILPYLPIVGLVALSFFWFTLSESMSEWFAAWRESRTARPVVARLLQLDGSLKKISAGEEVAFRSPLPAAVEIRDGDRIETSANSRATLALNSSDEMEMGPLAAVSLQSWNPKDSRAAVYVHWLQGTLDTRKAGMRGRAYVIKDGRLYFPGQKPEAKPLALTVLRSAPLDMRLAADATMPGADLTDDSGEEAADPVAPPTTAVIPDTLSNEYIDQMIAERQSQLQKCWLTHLKDSSEDKADVVLQFEISRRGRVHDSRIADSSAKSDTLGKCVMSVVDRIQFRSYRGPEISLSYPIKFE